MTNDNLIDKGNKQFEIFNYNNLGQVRVQVDKNGNPWFCLNDVCSVLGLNTNDSNKVLKRIEIPYQTTILVGINTAVRADGTQVIQNIPMNFISEAGLYQAIGSSRKPEAKVFMNWVFGEVLPMIRKTGAYFTDNIWDRIYEDPRAMGELIIKYAEEREKRMKAEQQVEELTPSANKWDNWISSKNIYTVHQASHILGIKGMGLKNLFRYFRNNGFVSDKNLAFRQYQDQGLFRVKEIESVTRFGHKYKRFKTFLTPKGIEYFKERLISEGYTDLDFVGEPEGFISDYVKAA